MYEKGFQKRKSWYLPFENPCDNKISGCRKLLTGEGEDKFSGFQSKFWDFYAIKNYRLKTTMKTMLQASFKDDARSLKIH